MSKILIIISVLFVVWIIFNFFLLVIKNYLALNTFVKLEKLLIKRYKIFETMNLRSEISKYLEELKNLPSGIKFLNRKLALNYIITKDLRESGYNNFTDEYRIVNSELINLGDVYNKKAMNLKTAVEVFPTAIMARFMNIKTVDFFRA